MSLPCGDKLDWPRGLLQKGKHIIEQIGLYDLSIQ